MKKLLLAVLILGCCYQINAQGLRLGLKASSNFSYVRPDSKILTSDGLGVGFSYGLIIDLGIGGSDRYVFSTGIDVSTLGSKINLDSVTYTPTAQASQTVTNLLYEYRLQYLQLPISLKMKTKEIGYITYWGQFGVSPSLLLRANANISSDGNVINLDDEPVNDENLPINFKDDVQTIRAALLLGAGIEYSLAGNTALLAGIRYDNGFTDFTKDNSLKATNSYLGLVVGILF